MYLAQGPQRKDAGEARTRGPRSQIKHSTTEPLHSQDAMVVDWHHVACVCGDWMKIPIFKKTFFFLKIGIFSKFGEKSPFHWELGRISAPENTK